MVMMKVRVLYGALLADEKIVVFERAADGSLAVRSEVACPGKPMWLCVNEQQNKMSTGQKSVLDACTLSNELVSFSIDPASGALKEISRIPLPPPTPTDPHGEAWAGPPCACHICRVGENRSSTSGSLLEREFVLTTCYTAGTVSVHGTDPESGAVAGDALDHQQTSHGCHSVNRLPGSDDFYVPCVAAWTGEGHDPNNTVLAGNRIYQYTLNRQSGKLSSVGEPYIPPPAGPVAEPRFGAKHSDASPISRFGTRPEEGPRHAAVQEQAARRWAHRAEGWASGSRGSTASITCVSAPHPSARPRPRACPRVTCPRRGTRGGARPSGRGVRGIVRGAVGGSGGAPRTGGPGAPAAGARRLPAAGSADGSSQVAAGDAREVRARAPPAYVFVYPCSVDATTRRMRTTGGRACKTGVCVSLFESKVAC